MSVTVNSPWRRHLFNWTGAGVLDTCIQNIFRYTGTRLAPPPQTLPSLPTSGDTGKIEQALWKCVTQQILYKEIPYRAGALSPIGNFPMHNFSIIGKFSASPVIKAVSLLKLDWLIGNSPIWKFCIGKFPIGKSGATSKTGLALGFCRDSFSARSRGGVHRLDVFSFFSFLCTHYWR